MKKILLPTDFSDQATYALKVAASLAKQNDATIYLMHMLELPTHFLSGDTNLDVPEQLLFMKIAHERFEKTLEQDFLKDIKIEVNVETHKAFDGITEAIRQYDIDLVVMGSSGASGLKEMFIGSNTEKVVRTSDVPVLVIKNDIENFNIENFVFASDFTNDQKLVFEQALDFANSFNATLHLLFVNTPNRFVTTAAAEKKMKDFIADFDELTKYELHVYNDDTIERGILNFSRTIDADLIGMSTHGRQGLAHFFNGSISEDLVNHALRPVITFRI
ncbi:TRAP-T-associated universal stress protein TeaD [Kordia antarctica]|uniref:TRAP-T-associated universal stress protein TeaD n=1 Tax=Kordia antarctica TaxID=1218801 RepID=A0A7L4ZPS6_9FLAO|nr:universal stress protein [Kordia antarctica]QHI38156.1 TRAP-T-associated universal stress protein TeaD [Kordia antarctica]